MRKRGGVHFGQRASRNSSKVPKGRTSVVTSKAQGVAGKARVPGCASWQTSMGYQAIAMAKTWSRARRGGSLVRRGYQSGGASWQINMGAAGSLVRRGYQEASCSC